MDILQAIIIAIVEGLTEFLPVSSTGHMIIAQNMLGVVQGDAFVHAFTFIIQFGAILSVVVLYWKRFFRLDHTPAPDGASSWQRFKHKWYFYWLLLVGVLHTGVSYALYFASMDGLRTQTVALFSYIDPVAALVLSALVLHESMSWIGLLGAALVLGSAAIGEMESLRKS